MSLLLAPLLTLTLAGGAPTPPQDLVPLLRATREPGWPGAAAVQEQVTSAVLADLGPALDILARRRVPALDAEQKEQFLSEVQRDLLLDALERAEPTLVRARAHVVEQELRGRGEAPTAALWILGAGGQGADSALAVRWCDAAQEEQRAGREVREALRLCTARIARRDPSCHDWLETAFLDASRESLQGALCGLGDVGDPSALPCLMEVVEHRADVADLALGQVRRLGRSLDLHRNDEATAALRPLLRDERATTRQEAARALAVLGDGSIVPDLLDMLESGVRGEREAARWALGRLSGRDGSDDVASWATWYARELEWREHRRRRLEVTLASPDVAEQAQAVLEVAHRELFLEDWAEVLLDAQPANHDVQVLICRSLGELGAVGAVPYLLDAALADDEELVSTCRTALERISGLRLPVDTQDWYAALQDRPRS